MSSDLTTENTSEHNALWELIPWYVNGSLSKQEANQFEQHLQSSPEFRAEVERQSALAVGVCEMELPDSSSAAAKSWETLSSQIAAEAGARSPQHETKSWWSAWLPNAQSGLALAGVAIAVVLVGMFATTPDLETEDGGFVTLTSETQSDQRIVKFQSVEGIDQETLARVLAKHGMVLIEEQSATGIFRASAPEGTDLKAAAAKLTKDPAIAFAAPE